MTNYEEEQRDELEALESIYPDSFTIVSTDPTAFSLKISTEESILDADKAIISVTLKFTYAKKYPDEAPLFEVLEEENFPFENTGEKLEVLIEEQIEENLGCVMVFTIMSAVQEFLNQEDDRFKQEIQEEEERKEREMIEEQERKCAGTKVTVASFLAWKADFDLKMQEIESQKKKQEKQTKKLSGKEIFLQSGDIEDESALLAGEEAVEVDESLFEELDDIDLDDEFDIDSDS
nr:RWD domain-containing protein 1-like [Ciona intestinalis]|eukprot:XP_002128914.1 RWD domain-containing protein 1-like [Ciona intestinalis]